MLDRARENRREMSPVQAKLWLYLRRDQLLGLRFRREHRVGPYIVDFYCAERNLVIEVDGESHGGMVEYDKQRTEYLESRGLREVRFTNDEVLRCIEQVIEQIKSLCEAGVPSPRPSP
jgi:very-short-patch-repair endonuclease